MFVITTLRAPYHKKYRYFITELRQNFLRINYTKSLFPSFRWCRNQCDVPSAKCLYLRVDFSVRVASTDTPGIP